jgi:hypothetical protein
VNELQTKIFDIHNHTIELFRLSEKELTAKQTALLEIEVENILIAITPKVVTNIENLLPE